MASFLIRYFVVNLFSQTLHKKMFSFFRDWFELTGFTFSFHNLEIIWFFLTAHSSLLVGFFFIREQSTTGLSHMPPVINTSPPHLHPTPVHRQPRSQSNLLGFYPDRTLTWRGSPLFVRSLFPLRCVLRRAHSDPTCHPPAPAGTSSSGTGG